MMPKQKNGVLVLAAALAVAAAAACSGPSDDSASKDDSQTPAEVPGAKPGSNDPRDPEVEVMPDALEGLPRGAAQLGIVCGRGQQDNVTKALCDNPRLESITDLQDALGLGFQDRSSRGQNGGRGNPAFALLGHSTSLVTREVSAINPRAFVFSPPPGRPVRIPG
ncbi:MAG TPA: hypothetical protein VLT33_17815, partial [Labilithrix sp.]|nr:hypothetical protein [Labilithrix sp.]